MLSLTNGNAPEPHPSRRCLFFSSALSRIRAPRTPLVRIFRDIEQDTSSLQRRFSKSPVSITNASQSGARNAPIEGEICVNALQSSTKATRGPNDATCALPTRLLRQALRGNVRVSSGIFSRKKKRDGSRG